MSGLNLPNELNLSPHLSAHKYFLVCTLTVAAWDTLVLTPRTYRLFKTPGWPALKILFHFLRVLMPVEFIIVAVAFFDTKWSIETCQKFYLFEPITTAFLLAATSAVHVIRIYAIYDKNRVVLGLMSGLFALQIVVTAIACGFYRSVPLLEGQGCIAGPKHAWVGIYWIAPTLLYTVSLALALKRSVDSLKQRPLSPWKLMLRDGLNLYGAIWIVNIANVLFWFIIKPDDAADPIRTIVTSMAAVLTTSMSLRIILSVRGTLEHGGSFALSGSTGATSSRTTHVISGARSGNHATNISTHTPHTYTLDELRTKPEGEWPGADVDTKSSVHGADGIDGVKNTGLNRSESDSVGVKITIDREIGYEGDPRYKQ
ncbi:hypothetical protein D9613_005921 [Agrocybe pediades]|uniref:DUF6533 domain-containing protein n=1 Tax=Agrocybe pediades TaxID=84607 RepID=A0A8H4QVE6_9AGAR|nr:hypothetical protein D9613_005921 [Agrocybe pediades]KAF9543306.1 hypothetical protein CPC08DRAFT_745355 [Agrocybe pediades]